ncbi:MAG: sulfatase [Elusimicrobia bacterium]|nr:sulfatase [Elusimicrobiota bacterium]
MPPRTRRSLLACALLAASAALPPWASGRDRRSLILISIDALRPDHVGALGYPQPVTPSLDRFAGQAAVFSNAVSQAPWTLPSMLSLFTSLYPHQHTVVNRYAVFNARRRELAKLPYQFLTLAQVLKEAGYATAAFTGGAGLGRASGLGRGFDVYVDSATFGGFAATLPQALAWLQGRRDRPFFLFVHGYDVHGQFGPRDDSWMARRAQTIAGAPGPASDEEVRARRAGYDARVARADALLGSFLERLGAMPGLRQRAVVVVFSDHGDELHEHGGVDHGMTLYDEVIRAVLMIRVPGLAPRRIPEQARLIDLLPTVLELLEVEAPARLREQMRGVSLQPLLAGQPLALDAFSETDFLLHSCRRSLRSAGGWKLIADELGDSRELYDLGTDPGERHNLLTSRPAVAFDLQKKLLRLAGD